MKDRDVLRRSLIEDLSAIAHIQFVELKVEPELKDIVNGSGFKEVESGQAVMRSGSKNLNATFMMPKAIQDKHQMQRFITLQVLRNGGIMVGVFDPEWGLTLPNKIFGLDDVKTKIPKTLQIFRKDSPKREI